MRARTWIAVGLAPVAALTIGLVAPAGAATVSTFADFEGSATDAPAGFYAYGGGGGGAGYGVEVIPDTDPLARPGQVGDNNVLSVGADVPGGAYAGFGQNFTTLTDLSAFDGLQLWMYGTNSGAVLQSELLDGKNPAASTASAERWDTEIVDSWTGWRLVQLPWAAYTPATDFPDAPDNGVLDTDSIWGFIFPVVSTTGPVTWKIDDIGVYSGGTVTPTVSVSPTGSVDEGDVAAITVSLNIAPTTPVTVDWATADGTATAGSDYTAASGSVTFAAGETSKTVSVTTLDDTDFEGNETFTVLLSGAVGANLGNAIQTVTLRDDEMAPVVAVWDNVRPVDGFDYSGTVPTGLDPDGNVVGFELFTDPGASAAVSAEVPPSPLPGHDATDTALRIDLSAPSYAGVTSKLTDAAVTGWIPQDWSRYGGLSFWLYGQNTGRSLFVDILDNRNPGATTDDAGRFSVAFTDDVLGWRYVELPFSTFVRKDVGNGAPNDGLTLSQMHGWAFGVTAAPEPNTWYIDDVALTVPETVVDEYEYATLPSGTDPDGIGLGFQPYNGPGASVTVAPLTDARTGAAPGADATNTALSVTLDVPGGSWGGVSYAFDDAGSWGSQDWSGSQGVSFWLYGQGTGDTLYVDLVDNRPEGSVTDNAGRHSASLVDDVLGWRFVELQWSDFAEKNIGNGAPSDGLTLTEIRGYAFGVVTTSGPREYLLDRFALWGDSLKDEPLLVGFDRATYTAAEGDVAEVIVTLSRVSDVPVTVDSGARTQTEDGRAVEGVDYVPTSGTLTFAPGQTRTTFTVTLPQDDKHELDKTVQLQLSGVSGGVATLSGFTRGASISITDDDARDPLLVEDFEDTPGLWRTTGGELTDVRITSTGLAAYPARSAGAATARFAVSAAYPGQSADEGVGQFTVSGDGATLTRPFAQP